MAQSSKSSVTIPASALQFLKSLGRHNDREWFNNHKDQFLDEQASIARFAEALLQQLNTHDEIETPSGKDSLFRIYRDTRFSTDKTPYRTNWAGRFKRATKFKRGGYYYQLEPGKSFLAGGFWGPNPQDLRRIRDEIAFDAVTLRKILKSKPFTATFGVLKGEQVKTAPKGFTADHESIDLLRYKQFLLIRNFTDEEVLSGDFVKLANQTFKNMRPFLDYMSETLTTDANGLVL
ncbi:DUF2461 domain-containing protein [Paraflavitalea sp. CAU 1676]|uniref:DUF2461 domain-containing protein n=1 Tax=Paraflavitalea sp. CAU 1676 TaxID=3032598 RepID=UPI0023DB07E1|nr:DUF2461 domain-containing protein [Paraflavitalea sp. CAU 1676]MDF2192799.1 DUF2461 domain-containing protein [Paraflavitalea sp. CAU 1676]